MQSSTAQDRFALRITEVARATGLSERCVWTHIKKGDIPSTRVGRAILVQPQHLQQWLDSQTKETANPQS